MNMESVAGLYKDGLLRFIHGGIDEIKLKKPGGLKSSITSEDREIILSVLFNDPHIFGYIRNTWSLRSLAKCLTNEIGISIKRPKLELLHGSDYEQGKEQVECS